MVRTRGKSAKTRGRGSNPFQRPLGGKSSMLPGEIENRRKNRAREAQRFALAEMNLSPREISELIKAVKIKSGRARGMPNISKEQAAHKRAQQQKNGLPKRNGFKRRTG